MLESLKKNKKGILIMSMSSCLACVGQLLWKLSAQYGILMIGAGFVLYGIGALLMIYAYRFGKVSVLQPVMSINYVFSLFLGFAILNESITPLKVGGVVLIILGVLMIGGADKE